MTVYNMGYSSGLSQYCFERNPNTLNNSLSLSLNKLLFFQGLPPNQTKSWVSFCFFPQKITFLFLLLMLVSEYFC